MNKTVFGCVLVILLVAFPRCLLAETNFEYRIPIGITNVYRVDAPAKLAPDAPMLIYMHGAGHDETQGMTLFPILLSQLAAKGWILVSPRYTDYDGLIADLTTHYGRRKIYLAGASAGARATFDEVCRNPKAYAGQFLIGPALRMDIPPKGRVTIPTFIIYGDHDGRNSEAAALVSGELARQKVPLKVIVIKGGGHGAPYGNQDWWWQALTFITGVEFKEEHAPLP